MNRYSVILMVVLTTMITVSLAGCASAETQSVVQYPEGISFDNRQEQRAVFDAFPENTDFTDRLQSFTYDSSAQVFGDIVQQERYMTNQVFSPVSLYYALSMASIGAAGETKTVLDSFLHMDGMDKSERSTAENGFYNRIFRDNEIVQLRIGNALWADDDFLVKEEYVNDLKDNLYASVHNADMSTEETGEAIGKWLSDQSNGLFGDNYEYNPSPETVMMLINAIYFKDQWAYEFDEAENTDRPFYRHDGSVVDCTYMYMEMLNKYYRGQDFVATGLSTKGHNTMFFIQTDEDIDLYEWLANPSNLKVVNLIDTGGLDESYGKVFLTVPKFDFGSEINIGDVMKEAGITEPFDQHADFSEISDMEPLFISDIHQKARISIDEKGIEASAFTEIFYAGAAQPEEDLHLTLDRPFIIVVRSMDQLLFVGVVNDPEMK